MSVITDGIHTGIGTSGCPADGNDRPDRIRFGSLGVGNAEMTSGCTSRDAGMEDVAGRGKQNPIPCLWFLEGILRTTGIV